MSQNPNKRKTLQSKDELPNTSETLSMRKGVKYDTVKTLDIVLNKEPAHTLAKLASNKSCVEFNNSKNYTERKFKSVTAHSILSSDSCEAHSRQNSILLEKQQKKRIYNKRYSDKMKTLKAPFTVNQQKQISQDKRKIYNEAYYQKKKMAKNNCTSEKTSIVL